MNKVTADDILRNNVRYYTYFHPDTLKEILAAMEIYKTAHLSSVSDEDVRNMLNMVCDQFNAGFAGRNEFINKVITDYKNKQSGSNGDREDREYATSLLKGFIYAYDVLHYNINSDLIERTRKYLGDREDLLASQLHPSEPVGSHPSSSSNSIEQLKCEMCGKQDETVKYIGFTLCPECNKKLGESMDACDKARVENEKEYGEFDGGGGA